MGSTQVRVSVVALLLAFVTVSTVWVPGATAPAVRASSGDPCTVPPVPDTWEEYSTSVVADSGILPGYVTAVDPSIPCLVHRSTGAGGVVERSEDGGRTWVEAYRPTAGASLTVSALVAPGSGRVYVADRAGGVSVVRSDDGGRTWWRAAGGIEGKPVTGLAVAPGDALVLYALVASTAFGPAEVWVTKDGGARWEQTALPPAALGGRLGVDPADPSHVFLYYLVSTSTYIVEGRDFGREASSPRPQAPNDQSRTFLVTRTGGRLRLYRASFANPTGHVEYSEDGGVTWGEPYTPTPYNSFFLGAADRGDGSRLLMLGRPNFNDRTDLSAFFTRTGFDRDPKVEQVGDVPVLAKRNDVRTVQVDAAGRFYADIAVGCNETTRCGSRTGNAQFFLWITYRFSPPDAADTFTVPNATGTPDPCAEPGVCGQALTEHHRCTVAPSAPASGEDKSGSVAFDGRWLYYTRSDETGPEPYQAVIRRLDPRTCRDDGRLVTSFDPDVYREVRSHAYSKTNDNYLIPETRPTADAVTYDPTHRELWFGLRATGRGERTNTYRVDEPLPVWSVPVGGWRAGTDAGAEARSRFGRSTCDEFTTGLAFLAYDRSDDTLWTCDFQRPGHVSASGASLRTCTHPIFRGYGIGRDAWTLSAWTTGAEGYLLVVQRIELEGVGRKTVWFHPKSCREERVYDTPAPPGSVPDGLAEQVACDAVTYGPATRAQPPRPESGPLDLLNPPRTDPTAVMWRRAGPLFVAYRIPDRTCPVPTTLRVLEAATVTKPEPSTVCAALAVVGPGVPGEGRTVAFDVAGRTVGQDITGDDGVACTTVSGLGAARHAVTASFAGDLSYLPAVAAGALTVLAPPEVPVPLPGAPTPPPPPRVEPPAPPSPPVPLIVPQVAPAPATPPAAQPIVQPQPITQTAAAQEKEKAPSLAVAAETERAEDVETAEEGLPEDDYAMAAVLTNSRHDVARERAMAAVAVTCAAAGLAALAVAGLGHAPAHARRRRRQR